MSSRPDGFAGYLKRGVPTPDDELTRVGPGTPCGEYMRRAWQPIAMSEELTDLPLAIRILGEDLVLFRDKSGRIGLLHKHCSHRGASLEYGIIQDRGLRCCYHGWHFDVDGRVLEIPDEPPGSPLATEIVHGAYPTREFAGLVFAYLGPPDAIPGFPVYDTLVMPATELVPFSLHLPCNWLQVFENTQDPIHVLHLHSRSSGVQFGAASGVTQIIDYKRTPLGLINVQTRRCGDLAWTRTTETILPNGNQGGAIWEEAREEKFLQRAAFTRWMVPIDDTNTVVLGWRQFADALDPDRLGNRAEVGKGKIDFVGQTPDRPYEERQRFPGDYEVQVSQRPIAIHALENLASSDRGVTLVRRLLREGIRALGRDGTPPQIVEVGDTPLPTYVQDTVCAMPLDPVDDHARLAEFGRQVAEATLAGAGQDEAGRRAAMEAAARHATARRPT